MARNFSIGDVVCVKSGGPKLTIVHIESGTCECIWFSGNDTGFKHVKLHQEALELVTDR